MASPQNLYLYDDDADIFDCAAAYAHHLAKNHPFCDGNKRTALEATLGFLKVNGLDPQLASSDLLYEAMVRLTEEKLSTEFFAKLLMSACTTRWLTQLLETLVEKGTALFASWNEPRNPHEPMAPEPSATSGFAEMREMAEAEAVDLITSFTRAFLIEKCEQYGINPKRFDGLPQLVEETLYPFVTEKLRRNFGMD